MERKLTLAIRNDALTFTTANLLAAPHDGGIGNAIADVDGDVHNTM